MPKKKTQAIEDPNLYPKDLQFVLSNYDKAKASGGITKFFNNIKKWHDQYMSRTQNEASAFYSSYPNMQTTADIFAPESFKAVQTIKSRLMVYTYQEDAIEIEEHIDCPPEVRDAYLQFILNQRRESKHEIEMEKVYLTMLKFGTGIVKKYWKVETTTKKVPVAMRDIDEMSGKVKVDPVTNEPLIKGIEQQEVTTQKGYPYSKNLNLKKVFLIGDTDNFYEIDGVIEEINNVDWEDLWKLRKQKQKLLSGKIVDTGIYFNLEQAVSMNLVPGETKEQEMDSRDYIDGIFNPLQTVKTDARTKTVKHNLLECWAWRDIDGKGKKVKSVITILDRKLVIRRSKIPFNHNQFPYLLVPCITQENSMYGIGMCQLVEGLQWELNVKRNQILDSVTFALNNMWIKVDSRILDHELKSKPGGIINSSRPDGVVPVKKELSDVNAGLASASQLQNEIKELTGATAPLQGQEVGGKGTLGEVQSMITEGSYRIVDIMKNAERHILYPELYMDHALNQQFIEKQVIVLMDRQMMINGKLKTVKNMPFVLKQEDIRFDFKFRVHAATQVENRLVKNQALMNYLMTLGKSGLPPQLIGLATYRLMKQIWVNLQLGEAEVVFPANLEEQIYELFGQPSPQGSQVKPEDGEKKLQGNLAGASKAQEGNIAG